MIGCWNSAGCWSCSTNMPSHFPNKSFIVSPCTLKTTLTALIHCNLLFCYRTNNKPGANEIIFSIIPKQPVSISNPPRFCFKKNETPSYYSACWSRMFLFPIPLTDITSCSKHLRLFERQNYKIYYLIFMVLYFSSKGNTQDSFVKLSFSLIAFSCSDKHRCICS